MGKTGKQIRSLLTIAAMVAIVETGKQLLNALPPMPVTLDGTVTLVMEKQPLNA